METTHIEVSPPFHNGAGKCSPGEAHKVFCLLKTTGAPEIAGRTMITLSLVQEICTLSRTVRQELESSDVSGLGAFDVSDDTSGQVPGAILESAFCQLAGRHLGTPAFLDEALVAEILEAIEEASDREFLEELLASDPVSAVEFHNRGNARCEAGDHEGALGDYSRAIALDPTQALFYFSRATCLLEHHHNSAGASEDYRLATVLGPGGNDSRISVSGYPANG